MLSLADKALYIVVDLVFPLYGGYSVETKYIGATPLGTIENSRGVLLLC